MTKILYLFVCYIYIAAVYGSRRCRDDVICFARIAEICFVLLKPFRTRSQKLTKYLYVYISQTNRRRYQQHTLYHYNLPI